VSIFIDHCVPRKFHRLLQEWGYSSTLLQDHVPVDSADPYVLQIVQTLDAVLLTVDLDFSNILDYPPAEYMGLIVLRYEPDQEIALIETLKQMLSDLYRDDLRQVLVIVEPTRYRIRKG
jgi:predicted nuclease of predicted toxin-antitoxin system